LLAKVLVHAAGVTLEMGNCNTRPGLNAMQRYGRKKAIERLGRDCA
jgi:hypothetical protein